ncbi:alginate lyase family protein [Flavobacterium sp. ov086]|uniref:alginate lyase family protein n=1 Tax=Flavobacterium sp. ov086 TaxID=1761785 RepID=UPI000B6E28AD|nr:alginate lyase family protein [Flavobacterium sp. ov086]SNR30665.1 Alginate lyase [Flavobacterium sp. ov086]
MNRILTTIFLSFLIVFISCDKSNDEGTDNGGSEGGTSTEVTTLTKITHLGLLTTLYELNIVKDNQNSEPWKSELAALKASASGSINYKMKGPFLNISRTGSGETSNFTGWSEHGKDATACYVQALLGYITGDTKYTQNAINIINSWSTTLVSVGGADVELLVGIQAPLWAQAGEILAYTNSGWQAADITRAKNMMTNIFQPAIDGFDPADGANFSTSCMYASMAIAVFTDDLTRFNAAWKAFNSKSGCPNDYSLYKNIAENGQNVESGRDQVHSWSSYQVLAGIAEIAYHQGLDPYTLGSNRLLTGVEYWSKYNLGQEVPFDVSVYRCRAGWGPWAKISDTNRGQPTAQGSVCNMIYHAYYRLNRLPTTTSYTKLMANVMTGIVVDPTSRNGWGNPFIGDGLLHQIAPGEKAGSAVK